MKIKRLIIGLILIIFIIGGFWGYKNYNLRGYINNKINSFEKKNLNNKFNSKIKSGNLSVDYNINEVLKDVNKFGLNTVNVPVIIDVKDLKADDMSINKQSEEKAVKLIKRLNKKGISIILEPYPWIKGGTLSETEWKPKSINSFFWNWKTKVLKGLIDDVAVPCHVDALNVASNYVNMEYAENYWCDTIAYVRRYYKGLVTYRTMYWITATWDKSTQKAYEAKLNNKLFSKVDFICISAYFELTDNAVNSVDNISNAILKTQRYYRNQNVKQEIKNFNDKWKKPIFFGELGFPKEDGASIEPWNPLISNTLHKKIVINGTEQANCFEAYRRNFEYEKWFLGFSIFAVGENGSDKMYYPSSESTAVIKKWFKN